MVEVKFGERHWTTLKEQCIGKVLGKVQKTFKTEAGFSCYIAGYMEDLDFEVMSIYDTKSKKFLNLFNVKYPSLIIKIRFTTEDSIYMEVYDKRYLKKAKELGKLIEEVVENSKVFNKEVTIYKEY